MLFLCTTYSNRFLGNYTFKPLKKYTNMKPDRPLTSLIIIRCKFFFLFISRKPTT